jgi:hypothetical protein
MAGSTTRFNNDRYYYKVGGYQADDKENNTNYIPLLSMVENILIKTWLNLSSLPIRLDFVMRKSK